MSGRVARGVTWHGAVARPRSHAGAGFRSSLPSEAVRDHMPKVWGFPHTCGVGFAPPCSKKGSLGSLA